MDSLRKAGKWEIAGYAFGGLGSNIAYILVMSYLTYFLTDIYGISALAVSGLMLVARIIDAVTDPMMGMISDRTRSRLGRYRPYLIYGAPFLGLSIFFLFCTPSLSPVGKIVYAYALYIIYSLLSTVCNIPYHALTPVMSGDPQQRTTIVTCKQAMTIPSTLFVGVLALPMVGLFGGGEGGWAKYGLFVGIITTLSFWLCAWGAKKKDTMDVMPTSKERIPFGTQIKLIFKNKPLLMLLIAFSTDQFAGAAASAVNVYYFIYFLGRKDLVAVVSMYTLAVNVVAFLVIPYLSKLCGKKRLYMISTALVIVPYTILYFMPANIPVIICFMVAAAGLATITGTLGWAMLPDCVEYGQWKMGIRGEGTISASLTFSNKVGMALGGSITGIILAATGYVAGQEQTGAVIEAIKAMKFLFPVAGYICSLISMSFYCITDKYFGQMIEDMKNGIEAENSVLTKAQN